MSFSVGGNNDVRRFVGNCAERNYGVRSASRAASMNGQGAKDVAVHAPPNLIGRDGHGLPLGAGQIRSRKKPLLGFESANDLFQFLDRLDVFERLDL